MLEFQVAFKNKPQRQFYYARNRNQCFSGGFNNGKTFIACLKALSLLLRFMNYRMIIAREKYTDLKRTTMQTFLKMCPSQLISSHNEQDGLTVLINGSMIWWLHLDNVDENTLRGIEPNSVLVDQAEETDEKVYDVLDGRVGRWDGAIVPNDLLDQYPDWPKKNGKHVVPSYHMLLCNPDTEFHYLYRKFHPDSSERNPAYFYVEGEWDRELGSEETYDEAVQRDSEWVDKYVKGKWGSSNAAIHLIRKESILEPTPELVQWVLEKGNLFRALDHGTTAPTCCLWVAAVGGVFIFYREYYAANQVISTHRKNIVALSGRETYSGDYADPHIWDKASQAKGGLYSVVDEYLDSDLDAPPLHWLKADNNEFATRNRINELLPLQPRFQHPVTKASPAPGIYFIQSSPTYPHGCKEAIRQIGAQRKKFLGTIDGKSVYDDARDDKITDHAYDCVRYYVAMHGTSPAKIKPPTKRNTFAYYQAVLRKQLSGPAGVRI